MNDSINPQPPGEGQDSWQEVLGGFPRHLTTQLIDEGGTDRARRELLVSWMLGVALTLFALALPQERLFVEILDGHANGFAPGAGRWHQWTAGLGSNLGFSAELCALVLSAIFYGASLPVAISFGRGLGSGFLVALSTSLLILLSPAAWVAGTSPGLTSLALLLGLLLMRELWRNKPLRIVRITALWLAGALTHGGFVWIFPALLTAVGSRTREQGGGSRRVFGLLADAPVLYILSTLVLAAPVESTSSQGWFAWFEPALAALFPPSAGDGQFAFLSTWLAGLALVGLPLIGLLSLVFLKRNEAEAAPPRWLSIWAISPLLAIGIWSSLQPDLPQAWIWLLPPALIGCLDLVARQDRKLGGILTSAALGGQLLLLGGVQAYFSKHDALADWRSQAASVLNPGDWVLSSDPAHAYLLKDRWGLDCELVGGPHKSLAARARRAAAEGRRVVLDMGPPKANSGMAQWEQELEGMNNLLVLRAPESP